jgi:hypothetical protein
LRVFCFQGRWSKKWSNFVHENATFAPASQPLRHLLFPHLDLKLRRKDYGARNGGAVDCVIELESHGTGGWLLKAGGAALILFATADTHRVAMFEAVKLRTAVMLHLSRWIANGLAKEITTQSNRGNNQWSSRAIVVSADLLERAIDSLDDCGGAANDADDL